MCYHVKNYDAVIWNDAYLNYVTLIQLSVSVEFFGRQIVNYSFVKMNVFLLSVTMALHEIILQKCQGFTTMSFKNRQVH